MIAASFLAHLLLRPPLLLGQAVSHIERLQHIEQEELQILNQGGQDALAVRYRELLADWPKDQPTAPVLWRLAVAYSYAPRPQLDKTEAILNRLIEENVADHAIVKNAKLALANRYLHSDTDRAAALFKAFTKDYATDDVMLLQGYAGLGRVAARNNDRRTAETCYRAVLMYEVVDMDNRDLVLRVQLIQDNAASSMLNLVSSVEDPVIAVAYLEQLLERYPQIEMWRPQSVDDRRSALVEQFAEKVSGIVPETVFILSKKVINAAIGVLEGWSRRPRLRAWLDGGTGFQPVNTG
jgi:hypothetical protein